MNRSRSVVAALAGLVAGTLILAGCSGKNAVDQTAGGQFRFVTANSVGKVIPVAQRKKAGNFTGQLLDGGTMTLAQDLGKVVVVNFWATWCGPCTTETPQFDLLYRSVRSKGVTFLGVDTKDIASKAKLFVKNNDISYPIVFDQPGQIGLAIGKIPSVGLPYTVVIDKHGRVAAVYIARLSDADLQPTLTALTAES